MSDKFTLEIDNKQAEIIKISLDTFIKSGERKG